MTSNIDPTKPQTGIDQPVKVIRDNFAFAKLEIEALQQQAWQNISGVPILPSFTQSQLPPAASVEGGLAYNTTIKMAVLSIGTGWIRLDTGVAI